MSEIVFTYKKMTQLCRACDRLVQADWTVGRLNHWHVSDRSVCPDCGAVLWDWQFDPHRPLYKQQPPKPPKGQIRLF